MNITLNITSEVQNALELSAERFGLDANVHAVRIVEDYLLGNGLLADDVGRDILLSRSLIERVVEKAVGIIASGEFESSITFDAIQMACADDEWLSDYKTLVRDDPFKSGNPRKQVINQNLGYFIKKAVGARSKTKPDGKPMNVKVTGSIIQSYTPLEI